MKSGRCTPRARFGSLVIFGLSGLVCSSAVGHDGRWVTAEGRKIGLTRSKNELAVKLRSCDQEHECARRLESAGLGKLDRFQRAPQAQFKVVRQVNANRDHAQKLLEDPAIEDVQHIYRFDGTDTPLVGTQTIVVKTQRGMGDADVRALWAEYGIIEAVAVFGLPRVFEVGAPEGKDELHLAEQLADDPRTEWSQPNFRRETNQLQVTPNDEFFEYQWHLDNSGQLNGVSGADIGALDAWTISTGEGVVVGSFDDAVDVDHEDLRDNYLGFGHDATLAPTADGYDDPRPKRGDFFGSNRHGTATMGLMAARANSRGGRGVAYNAKFTTSRGLNDLATDGQVAGVWVFARDAGVDVHSNSWSYGPIPDPAIIANSLAVAFAIGRNSGDDDAGTAGPRGMPIFFSSGNSGSFEFESGFYLAALPYVMAIGSSNDRDQRSSYSSFGQTLSVLAPSNGSGGASLFTTDNSDSSDIDQGYNIGEFAEFLGEPDSTGNYTAYFGGTSGACPIAAGVAALCLSANPNLTATDIRMLIEHTAVQIEPQIANYDPITSHSLTHGYGRVSASGTGSRLGAVEAAQESVTNGGHTWPDRPADVVVDDSIVRWIQGSDTMEFLVVQSDSEFGFIPEDGVCYDAGQSNCSGEMKSLPGNVTTLAVGCGLTCSNVGTGDCALGDSQCVEIPQGKQMALYARNAVGRYSFGVAFDSAGNVFGSGRFVDLTAVEDVDLSTDQPTSRPHVTISVSPLEGDSPLAVTFRGNAVSTVPIDETRTTWDFDLESPPEIDATTRNASYVYTAEPGQTRIYIARLTMYDINGTPGSEEVAITVHGPDDGSGGSGGQTGNLQIIVGLPNTPDSDVSSGRSPFSVVLTVDATSLPGNLVAINWDLGDGTASNSLVVPHTYTNETAVALRIPITVTVSTATSPTTTVNTTATRIITVEPGSGVIDPGDVGECELPGTCAGGPGGSASPCGVGILPVLLLMVLPLAWRRR